MGLGPFTEVYTLVLEAKICKACHHLVYRHQCALFGLPQSTLCYRPTPVRETLLRYYTDGYAVANGQVLGGLPTRLERLWGGGRQPGSLTVFVLLSKATELPGRQNSPGGLQSISTLLIPPGVNDVRG